MASLVQSQPSEKRSQSIRYSALIQRFPNHTCQALFAMKLSKPQSGLLSVGELIVATPLLAASLLVWWNLPPSPFSACAFVALIELGFGLLFLRTYIRGFPSALRDAAEANTLRLDGSESSRRTSVELHAIRRLRWDLLGSLTLTLIVVNLLIGGCYLALMQLPASAEDLDAEKYLPIAWTMLLVAALATCGTGLVLLLRTFHLSMNNYAQNVRERAEKYARLDVSRMQDEFQEEELDYSASLRSGAPGS
jgi:hypothetical protein